MTTIDKASSITMDPDRAPTKPAPPIIRGRPGQHCHLAICVSRNRPGNEDRGRAHDLDAIIVKSSEFEEESTPLPVTSPPCSDLHRHPAGNPGSDNRNLWGEKVPACL